MAIAFRQHLSELICEAIKFRSSKSGIFKISSLLEIKKNSNDALELHLPVTKLKNMLERNENYKVVGQAIAAAKYDEKIVRNVHVEHHSNSPTVVFSLENNAFVESILNGVRNLDKDISNHWVKKNKVVVEFSSPNMAKPFHVGHLRSTIIGQYISNIKHYLGNNVVRLNYLGDWGTQYGLLKLGVEMLGISEEDLRKNPISSLYSAYVAANKAASTDSKVFDQARKIFADLEGNNSVESTQQWQQYRKYTVAELKYIYSRLGVRFDEYAWESQYGHKNICEVISRLESKGMLVDEMDGRKIVEVGDRRVPIIKSDGTTLYLARDIAALLDRSEKYDFDEIYYVVDSRQNDHFHYCFCITSQLEPKLSGRTNHISFGRIKGMSTREGNVLFLKDVLDQAKALMMKRQSESETTKAMIDGADNSIADVLGVSALIVNDLKQRRNRDYNFEWSKALQFNGDTGIKLQYTHCRLCSLLQTTGITPAEKVEPKMLQETVAVDLIKEIGRFPEVLLRSEETLKPCELVIYLFGLSNRVSRALKELNIKRELRELQEQRILLFTCAKRILFDGMRIIGLKPLEQM